MATNYPVNMDTSITVKVQIEGSNRKFKLPLRDLLPSQFPQKLRSLLAIPDDQEVLLERFSDSAAAYVQLDPSNVQVYKTLMRAAKAKLKLRIRATMVPRSAEDQPTPVVADVVAAEAASDLDGTRPRPVSIACPMGPKPGFTLRTSPCPALARQSMIEMQLPTVADTLQASKGLPEVKTAQHGDGEGEAPVPRTFEASEHLLSMFSDFSKGQFPQSSTAAWTVYCNNCDNPMANEHFHCSICEAGDYDLCPSCVESGIHCPGEGHWLIKRLVQNGKVINSTTEQIAPKPRVERDSMSPQQPNFDLKPEMPGTFTEEKKSLPDLLDTLESSRTCNSCVAIYPDKVFVTCNDCEDFDLCIPCHLGGKHGHHPAHTFQPATDRTRLSKQAEALCPAGRGARHNAICDGCDQFIYGVRHKCLNCPDWDYCSKCVKDAKANHPTHRFVPIYEALPESRSMTVRHYAIYCDGPLCKDKENQSYIEGVRYKCAVCHDTDFCAACEALPTNRHNRTHPLIKFKTPVRNVSITTTGEDKHGVAMATMGDQFRAHRKSVSTETLPVSLVNAATQVQTATDLKPTVGESSRPAKHLNIKDLLSEPIEEKPKVQDVLVEPVAEPAKVETVRGIPSTQLNAHFLRDTVTDGSKMPSGIAFTQTWTLRNPGPHAWAAGCSVRYVGGDSMLNVDDIRPSTAAEITSATESNVIGREVGVGEEVSFSVVMKAPKREGTAISYWRIKAPDGTPFGHRLWCHIVVVPSITASIPASNLVDDYRMKLLKALAARNVAHMQQVSQGNEDSARDAESKKALDEAEKRHANIRAQALEDMRRTAAMIDGDMKKITNSLNSLNFQTGLQSTTDAEVESEVQQPSEVAAPVVPVKTTSGDETTSSAHNSAMIFPTLEKESPVSSTHEASNEVALEGLKSPSIKSDLEIFEDAESVEFFDDSSEQDGFVTDEEYDILDASDEETV